MDVTKILGNLFVVAVFFGALVMILSNPVGANTLIKASADTVTGITKSLEGR